VRSDAGEYADSRAVYEKKCLSAAIYLSGKFCGIEQYALWVTQIVKAMYLCNVNVKWQAFRQKPHISLMPGHMHGTCPGF
jgi:hypothetical protein